MLQWAQSLQSAQISYSTQVFAGQPPEASNSPERNKPASEISGRFPFPVRRPS
ncbi:hypothetical protein RESH_06102 [Rhodopirellula europaea SH398]|uniref:Uncharacterized protein n=2 Tax=Rhodopirellula europaea TaxID=1263866 RepID=M2AWC6_9BACT|nr:hypothetical protein RE6C_02230 [Rhodopirellula europaea 6C]EMI23340.1 hypothetical protein RESH_06102 [Rhodopirellula europaea SH398]